MFRTHLTIAALLLNPVAAQAATARAHDAPSKALEVAHSLQDAFAAVAAHAKPAVVNISTVHEEEVRVISPFFLFGDPQDWLSEQFGGMPPGQTFKRRLEGVGSGFIIDQEGHVLTNDHVVRGADQIRVTLTSPSGKEETLPGRVVGRDPNLDLAVVQIQSSKAFPYLQLGDSDHVRVGDWVIAIGSPFALQQTVTAGIVSAQRQTLLIEGRPYLNLLQTDAAINRGNSGGPLINLDGEVIGVNSAIYSPSGAFSGIGFAIPINEVKLALEYLLAGKRRSSGWLGVEVAPLDEVLQRRFGLGEAYGALVNSVVPQSPAAQAGLRRGDVIVRLGANPIASPQELVARVSRLKPGTEVRLDIQRGGSAKTVTVRLGERPEPSEMQVTAPRRRLEPQARETFKWEGASFAQAEEGVRVLRVEPSSPLKGTLQEGDVLRGIDSNQVQSLGDLKEASRQVNLSAGVVFDVLRNGRPMYLSLRAG